MAAAQVTQVSAADAARIFGPLAHLDPDGIATGESVARAGQPLRLDIDGGSLLMVLDIRGGDLWIEGAAGQGSEDMTRAGLTWAEETARAAGCSRVGFQTLRRGLMRKAKRLGYVASGNKFFKGIQ